MKIVDEVKKIIDPIYMVGGSVRDEVMGREPKDYDFATPIAPNEIEQRIRDAKRRPYLIGKRFGTIGVKIDGQMVEITTFRQEKYDGFSRKPTVEFVGDLTSDLSRRDFTMNAMAKRDGRFIDPFGGREDIKRGVIRSVGNATIRFKEDPLRMLRAARFSSQFEFGVDKSVEKSATRLSHRILRVSKERWVMELDKLLMTDCPLIGLDFLMRTGVMRFIIPELWIQDKYDQRTKYHAYDLWTHTMMTVANCPKDIDIRWAALLHDVGKPFAKIDKGDRCIYPRHEMIGRELALKIGGFLRWSNSRIEYVSELVGDHLHPDSPLKEADIGAKGVPSPPSPPPKRLIKGVY